MSDQLDDIFKRQAQFMDMLVELKKFPEYPIDLRTKEGQRFAKEVTFNLVAELFEACIILKNKVHRLTDDQEIDFPHYLEEVGDALAFLVELCHVSGISSSELYKEYCRKNAVVKERLKNGY